MSKNISFITPITFIFLLTACGGSSTNDTTQQTVSPTIVSSPAFETSVVETPAVETPAVETPAVETPAVETSVVETPAVESPVVETPAVETPAVETPAVETPVVESPVVETPINDMISINLNDISIMEGGLVALQAEITTDLDKKSLSYKWTLSPNDSEIIVEELSDKINFIAPLSDGEDIILALTVTVTDNTARSVTASSTVTVFNDVPTLSLLNNITANEKQTVTIDSMITNKENINSYVWTINNFPTDIITTNEGSVTLDIPALVEDVTASITLTITDNDGDSASATTDIYAIQLFEPLTIEGVITDSVIINSNVTIDIGDRQIHVNGNEHGQYSASIKIDDDEVNNIIKITGFGIDKQANAGLVSILGSAEDLLAQAGNDGVLNADENFSVNITHLTTAQFGLMLHENNGKVIDNGQILAELKEKIDFTQTMAIANAIKLVIDYSDEISADLPTGMSHTIDLIENIPAALAYVQSLIDNTELYNTAFNATLNDISVIIPPSIEMPESLHWVPLGVPSFSIPIWQFYSNNQGSYAGNIFTWQVEGNIITGSYISPVKESNSETLITSNGSVMVNYQEIPSCFILTIVNDDNGIVEFVHKRTVTKVYDADTIEALSIEDPSGEFTFINGHTSYRKKTRQSVADLSDKVAYLPIKTVQINDENARLTISADKYSFADNGTGTTLYSGKAFTWLQTDHSVVISTEISDDTTETATISLFHDGTSVGPVGFNLAASDTDDITTLGGIAQNNIHWNTTEVAGVYESIFKSRNNTLSHLWFELKENGDANTFATNDDNGDGVINESELYQAYGKWAIEDNKLTMTRIVKVNTEESSPEHREPNGDWQQYHMRTWELISKKDNQFGILNKHDFTIGLAYPQRFGPEVAEVNYDIRLIDKVNEAPVDISHLMD